jgi:hypothetical protein
MDWIHLSQVRDQWQAHGNKLSVSIKGWSISSPAERRSVPEEGLCSTQYVSTFFYMTFASFLNFLTFKLPRSLRSRA